jgi:hypothetical protein
MLAFKHCALAVELLLRGASLLVVFLIALTLLTTTKVLFYVYFTSLSVFLLTRCGHPSTTRRLLIKQFVWFLAPTVELCSQQFDYLQSQITTVEIKFLSGRDGVDRCTYRIFPLEGGPNFLNSHKNVPPFLKLLLYNYLVNSHRDRAESLGCRSR